MDAAFDRRKAGRGAGGWGSRGRREGTWGCVDRHMCGAVPCCAVLCRAVLLAGCAERWRRRVRHGTAAGVERQGASENVPPRLRIRI